MAQKRANSRNDLLTLQEMFRVVGDQLTARDVRVLKFMFSGIFTAEFLSQIRDGVSFLQALEKVDKIDESNFKNLENYLRIINRHDLYQFLTLRRRTPVKADPVTEYIERTSIQKGSKKDIQRKSCPKCTTYQQQSATKKSNRKTSKGNTNCPGHPVTMSKPSTFNMQNSSASAADQGCGEFSDPGWSGTRRLRNDSCPSRDCSSGPDPSKRRCMASEQPSCSSAPTGPVLAPGQQMKKHSVEKGRSCKRRRSLSRTPQRRSERLKKRLSLTDDSRMTNHQRVSDSQSESEQKTNNKSDADVKKKVTCDIRLHVRAEYCSHESALEGNVHSNKPELIERQFEKFMQANMILKSRDLGSIICDIKFSDLTYLDAFWRDYISGSLLEALKGVFITETLKQAVGHEAIKLMVNVDEDDYESGRLALLKNLQEQSS